MQAANIAAVNLGKGLFMLALDGDIAGLFERIF